MHEACPRSKRREMESIMKKVPRTKDIQNLVASYTANGITAHTYDFSSCNAHDIALLLKIDRTNVSRVLNQLHRENRLIKLQGRPTLYLDAGVIHSFSTEPVPYTLPVGRDIQGYLNQEKPQRVNQNSSKLELAYTGIQVNESLHTLYQELLAILMYPQSLQSIALSGSYGEGKHHFLKFFIEKAKELQLLSKHTQLLDYILDDTADNKPLLNVHPDTPAFILLDVQDSDVRSIKRLHQKLTEQHASLHSSWILCYLFHDNKQEEQDLAQRFIEYPMIFPSYEKRTLKERLEIIFTEIQKQSDILNQTICLNKNVLTCMALADGTYTTQTLLQELRRSIIRAHYSFVQRRANIIDITFEHLSDGMLNSIRDVSSRFAELHSILDMFDGDVLYFIPQTSCRFFNTLHRAVLNEQHLIESNDSEQIVSICNSMLKKTEKIEINTIRSIFVKELYDLMFPLLSATPLKQQETMIFVLFEYLQNLIAELKNDTYRCSFTQSHGLGTKRTDAITDDITQIIQSKMQVILPDDERMLISTYLQLAIQKLEAKTPMLFLCHGEDIAANYEKYIRSANLYDNCYSIDYSEAWRKKEFRYFLDYVCGVIQQIDHHETLFLFSDIAPLTEIGEQLSSRLHIEVQSYAPISLPLILNTISAMSHGQREACNPAQTPSFPITSLSENSRTLIDRISRQILQQSLVFLDANKASASLMIVLLNILKKLKLNYSDEITIRFIIHGAFVIERAVRSDPLPNKKTREIINSHADVYNTISEELNELNNIFDISISKAEIATITQIFLEYM